MIQQQSRADRNKAMTTDREQALAELAAIRAAAPLYLAAPAATEAEAEQAARAEAATAGTEATGKARGAIARAETTEAAARAAEARKLAGIQARAARAEQPAIEWRAAPQQQPRKATEAEQAAARAEKKWAAAIARESIRAELAEARAAEARQARRNAVVGSAESMLANFSPAELAEAARKNGAASKLAAAEARAAFLAETGLTEAEAREQELLAEAEETVSVDVRPATLADLMAGPKTDAGQDSALSPAELAAVREWTRAALSSPAARAGRQALEAIGPVASAMVVTNRKARKLTVAKVMRVPNVETAEARAGKAGKALEAARERLAAAEAAEAAAIGQGARQPIRAAEAAANRIAESVRKLAARASKADMMLAEATEAAGRPRAEALVFLPVATFKLSEAEQAAALDLRKRSDRMPARYADRGPSAKGLPSMHDTTAALAIAKLTELTEAETAAYWAETYAMVRELLASKAAAEAAAEAETIAARKAKRAAAARDRRRNSK